MKKFLILIALLIAALPAAAQESAPLIIRHYDTSLLTYDGTETRRMDFCVPEDGDSYSGFPIVFSPDASRFAYVAFTGSGNLTHIYICDLAEQALIPVAGQDAEKVRSTPSWSPDGARLAWNEVEASGSNLQTVIYDFADNSSEVVYEREQGSRAFIVPNVEWGQSGLAVYDEIMSGEQPQSVLIYIDPSTGQSQTIELEMAAQIGRWARYGETERFVLDVAGSQITTFALETLQVETLTGRLEHFSLSAPADSLGLSVIDSQWTVFGPDFNGSLGLSGNEYSVTVSPDGQALAFLTFENYPFGGKVYTLDSFVEFPYFAEAIPGFDQSQYNQPGPLYVFWGPMGLRIVE